MIVIRIRKGRGPVESFRVESLPTIIGRDAGSDIWIDHPNVSARHARLEARESGYAVMDLGGRNGLRIGRKKQSEICFSDRCAFRIGDVHVEVISEEASRETTKEFSLFDTSFRWQQWAPIAGWVIVAALLRTLLMPTRHNRGDDFILLAVLPYPLIVASLALVVAFWSKLQVSRYRYADALALCAPWFAANIFLWCVIDTIAFNWPWGESKDFVYYSVHFLFWTAVALQVGWFVFRDQRRRLVAAVVTIVAFLLLGMITGYKLVDPDTTNYKFSASVGYPLTDYGVGDINRLETGFRAAVTSLESRRERELAGYTRRRKTEADAVSRLAPRAKTPTPAPSAPPVSPAPPEKPLP